MTFGENVRARRRALGKSQAQVAKEVGISREAYYAYEKKNAMPRKTERLVNLAEALGCTVNDLYKDYEKKGMVVVNKTELESILKIAQATMLNGAIAIETNREDLNQIAIEMLRHHADEIKVYLNRLE